MGKTLTKDALSPEKMYLGEQSGLLALITLSPGLDKSNHPYLLGMPPDKNNGLPLILIMQCICGLILLGHMPWRENRTWTTTPKHATSYTLHVKDNH